MELRILQHEKYTDNIRIGATFDQNTRTFENIAEEVRSQYTKLGGKSAAKYLSTVAIVDAKTLKKLHIIYSDKQTKK